MAVKVIIRVVWQAEVSAEGCNMHAHQKRITACGMYSDLGPARTGQYAMSHKPIGHAGWPARAAPWIMVLSALPASTCTGTGTCCVHPL